jgi:hypothetical protein
MILKIFRRKNEIQQFPAIWSSSLRVTFDIAETAGLLNEYDYLQEKPKPSSLRRCSGLL